MQLPPDIPSPSPAASSSELSNLTEAPPPVTPAQREADFTQPFVWHGERLNFSVASDGYYRHLRVTMNAPPLASFQTLGDFTSEAPRVLYCSALSAAKIQSLYLLPPEKQVACYTSWVEENIQMHELEAAAELATKINETIYRARSQPMETEKDIDGLGNLPSHP